MNNADDSQKRPDSPLKDLDAGRAEPRAGFDERFWTKFTLREKSLAAKRGVKRFVPALALSGVVLAVLVFARIGIEERPVVGIRHGQPALERNGEEDRAPLQAKTRLKRGDRVTTGPADWIVLEYPDGYRVKVGPRTTFSVEQLKPRFFGGATVFRVARGEMLVSIGDGGEGRRYPIEVRTENAVAKATGTQFMVQAPAMGARTFSRISVLQGTVQVARIVPRTSEIPVSIPVRQGEEVRVAPQEIASALVVHKILDDEMERMRELFQFGQRNQFLLFIGPGPERVNELLEPCLVYMHIDDANPNLSKFKSIGEEMRAAVHLSDRRAQEKAIRKFEDLFASQTEVDPVAGALFTGAYYYSLGFHEDAVRVFERVAANYRSSSYRSLALAAAAKIYREKLGNATRADELTSEILQKYPESPEAQ